MGKSSTKAKNKYNKTAYKRISVHLKPEVMEVFNRHCEAFSYTKNNFIIQAIKDRIEKETGKNFNQLLAEVQPIAEIEETKTTKSAESSGIEKGEE